MSKSVIGFLKSSSTTSNRVLGTESHEGGLGVNGYYRSSGVDRREEREPLAKAAAQAEEPVPEFEARYRSQKQRYEEAKEQFERGARHGSLAAQAMRTDPSSDAASEVVTMAEILNNEESQLPPPSKKSEIEAYRQGYSTALQSGSAE